MDLLLRILQCYAEDEIYEEHGLEIEQIENIIARNALAEVNEIQAL